MMRVWEIRWSNGARATVRAASHQDAEERAQKIAPKLKPWAIVLMGG